MAIARGKSGKGRLAVLRRSNGRQCLGVFGSKETCERARDKSGLPVLMNKVCKCDEWRCKAHCKCDREKKLKGRSKARGVGAKTARSSSVSVSSAAVVAPVLAPVGRAAAAFCECLEVERWYRECCTSIGKSAEVELASYCYDNPLVQKVLLQKLRGDDPFKLNVYVDGSQLEEKGRRFCKARLRELRACGERCTVFVCKGHSGKGIYHCKAVVVDRRHLFTGGANLSYSSHLNEELCFKMAGPVVRQVLERLAAHRSRYKVWDGK